MNLGDFQKLVDKQNDYGFQRLPSKPRPRRIFECDCVCDGCVGCRKADPTGYWHCMSGIACHRTRQRRRTPTELANAQRAPSGHVQRPPDRVKAAEAEQRRKDYKNEWSRQKRRAAGVLPRGEYQPTPKQAPAAHAAPVKHWYVYAHRNDTTITLPVRDEDEGKRCAHWLWWWGWDGLSEPNPIVGHWDG